jgi:plasmid maintenance system antidote protein VapI
MEINKNIKKLIEQLGISPYEFSKSLGNKRADNIYNIIKEKVDISPTTLGKIFETYPEYKNFIINGDTTQNMNDKDKIEALLKHFELNVNEFSEKLGLQSPNTIYYVQRERNGISSKLATKILNTFPEISSDWLISGNGKMLKHNNEQTKKYISVPLIPVETIADFSGIYENCEQYAVPEFEQSGCEFVIRVSGSSMYPKYSNGDILACKKILGILFFQWGKTYVINSSQGVLVKQIFEDKENPDNIMLVSDNKENFPPFSMPKSDIRSLSIVLGVIRME